MTHPEELLAGYVDGTLSAQERTAVETHAAGCARCSREIELASHARSALGSLEEMPAPADIGSLAIQEAAGGRAAPGSEGPPRWYRVGGIVGAVAAGLLVFTLVLPRIGQDDAADGGGQRALSAAERDTGANKFSSSSSGIEISHENYDNASLTALISSIAAEDASAEGGAVGAAGAPNPMATGSQAQVDKALSCIIRSAPGETGTLQRLIRARFEGTPAYFAVFTEGPGAGQPADTAVIWVFATDDCRILSSSLAQL
jgi:anti-sigma factor RsiW